MLYYLTDVAVRVNKLPILEVDSSSRAFCTSGESTLDNDSKQPKQAQTLTMACSNTALSSLSSHLCQKAPRQGHDIARHYLRSEDRTISHNRHDAEFEAFARGSDKTIATEEDFSSAWNPELLVNRPKIKKRHHERALPSAEAAIAYSGSNADEIYNIIPTITSNTDLCAEFLAEQENVETSRTHWNWGKVKSEEDDPEDEPITARQEALREVAKTRLSTIAAHIDKSEFALSEQWEMEKAFQSQGSKDI